MKNLIESILIIGLLLSFSIISIADDENNQSENKNNYIEYVPHDPISIQSDEDFTIENGVTSGNGTENNPYIIEGLEVEEIFICGNIEKISKYFEINNCKINGRIFLRLIEDDKCKHIKNCEFVPDPKQEYGIYSGGYINNLTVENCLFFLNESTGISIGHSISMIVRNCEFYSKQVYSKIGIKVGDNSSIDNCYFYDSYVGIYTGDYNIVRNCTFINSKDEGIVIRGNYNLIEDCTFIDESMGIEISTEINNATIKNCTFLNNFCAIASFVMNEDYKYSSDHIIENCEFKNCSRVIDIWQSQRITVRDCVFKNNKGCLDEGSIILRNHYSRPQITKDCKIYNNYFLNNDYAIIIEASDSNKVVNNTFYNNYFKDNYQNVLQIDEGKLNKQNWNIEKTLGTNIIGGPYIGGNFWEDYEGKDNDGDGIGDTPYWINEDEAKDELPLCDNTPPEIKIIKPERGLYFNDLKIKNYVFKFRKPFIIGKINITIDAKDNGSGINRVEFYIDDKLIENDITAPYSYLWDNKTIFKYKHTIKLIAYDKAGNSAIDEIIVRKFL